MARHVSDGKKILRDLGFLPAEQFDGNPQIAMLVAAGFAKYNISENKMGRLSVIAK